MKENVLDVLMYLFENYLYEAPESNPERESLQMELASAGFPFIEINKAIDWLDGMKTNHLHLQQSQSCHSIRMYARREMAKMDCECRGYLLYLEQIEILTPILRELVIDRIMALDSEQIDLEQLKWLVLMVLFNQPGNDEAYSWLEEVMMDTQSARPH